MSWPPRWVWIAFGCNLVLWAVAVPLSLRVSDDPMFAQGSREQVVAPHGVAGFDFRVCFDCPEYVFLGREVGLNGGLVWLLPGALNAPALHLAAGREVGFGMREVSGIKLFVAIAAEWLLFWALWSWWRRRRSRLAS
jgi:hypothetical protein